MKRTVEELEFSDYGRRCNPVVLCAFWIVAIAGCVLIELPILRLFIPLIYKVF